jgi:hypothetical protein
MGREFSRRADTTTLETFAPTVPGVAKAPDGGETRPAPVPGGLLVHGLGRAADPAAQARLARAADPVAQAAALERASGGRLARVGGVLLRLQRDLGNRYVQRVVDHATHAGAPAPVIQPTRVVGQPHDRYEQEADEVARRVVGHSVQPASDELAAETTARRPGPKGAPRPSRPGGRSSSGAANTVPAAPPGSACLPMS